MDFIKTFEKSIADVEGIGSSSEPPRYWYSTGNYVLNKIISGDFQKGIPQGRITSFVGPSGAGKSFVTANCIKNAQAAGAFNLVIDSENALDDTFMTAIGVDIEKDYMYRSVTTVPQVTKVVSSFLQGYKKEYGNDRDAPQVLISIDSLDMLLTESEVEHFESGNQKGDQGQRNKQLKQMLRTFVQGIKGINATIITTSQVYANQNVLNGEGLYVFSDAVKYSCSQIIMLTKLKLRDTGSKSIEGIRMKCDAMKTRFTRPFQVVTIEVPYSTGMDPLSGLIDTLQEMKILERKGAWYQIVGTETKFQAKGLSEYVDQLLSMANETDVFLEGKIVDDETDDEVESKADTKARRGKKV